MVGSMCCANTMCLGCLHLDEIIGIGILGYWMKHMNVFYLVRFTGIGVLAFDYPSCYASSRDRMAFVRIHKVHKQLPRLKGLVLLI